MEEWIMRLHVLFSLYMLGLIWFVQVVHYPLMGRVGRAQFVDYENAHTRLTSWVTAPPMLAELGTGMLLLYSNPGEVFWWANGAGMAAVWASTFFIQVPLHTALSRQFDPVKHRQLVYSNWIRTVVWSLRAAALVFYTL